MTLAGENAGLNSADLLWPRRAVILAVAAIQEVRAEEVKPGFCDRKAGTSVSSGLWRVGEEGGAVLIATYWTSSVVGRFEE